MGVVVRKPKPVEMTKAIDFSFSYQAASEGWVGDHTTLVSSVITSYVHDILYFIKEDDSNGFSLVFSDWTRAEWYGSGWSVKENVKENRIFVLHVIDESQKGYDHIIIGSRELKLMYGTDKTKLRSRRSRVGTTSSEKEVVEEHETAVETRERKVESDNSEHGGGKTPQAKLHVHWSEL